MASLIWQPRYSVSTLPVCEYLCSHRHVHNSSHVIDDVGRTYLRALESLNLSEVARQTGRSYRTLQAYRMGERRVTERAVRELVEYLRRRAESDGESADGLEAALRGHFQEEETHG